MKKSISLVALLGTLTGCGGSSEQGNQEYPTPGLQSNLYGSCRKEHNEEFENHTKYYCSTDEGYD